MGVAPRTNTRSSQRAIAMCLPLDMVAVQEKTSTRRRWIATLLAVARNDDGERRSGLARDFLAGFFQKQSF